MVGPAPTDRADALLRWRTAIGRAHDDRVAALVEDTGRLTEAVMDVPMRARLPIRRCVLHR